MNSFVIIFRQGREITAEERQRRFEETGAWVRQTNAAGHQLVPHILGPESVRCGPALPAGAAEPWPVTAILLLDAHDLAEAVRAAEAHPALRYGANAEVRPWTAPVPPPAAR